MEEIRKFETRLGSVELVESDGMYYTRLRLADGSYGDTSDLYEHEMPARNYYQFQCGWLEKMQRKEQ